MTLVGIQLRRTHNREDPEWVEPGSDGMRRRRHSADTSGEPRRTRRRREITPEQQAYREAHRRANLKIGFITHFLVYASVCTFLSLLTGFRVGFIVGLSWGIGIVCHYFAAIVAPDLRRRLIEREVSRQVERDVSRERRHIEDKHVRSLEELSASIAHEIRNPITAAKSLVQQMGEDPSSTENVDYANVALGELDRVERSISHLLRYARDEEIRFGAMQLDDVVDSALETFRDRVERLGVEVVRDVTIDGAMHGDAEKLRRVLINLIGNALDALGQAHTPDPRIEVAAGENLAGTQIWLRVRDNGPGIDPAKLAKIFSPFYTSKEGGTGLGLAISKKVVDAHGGSIEASSVPGSGAEFLLTFPKQGERNATGAS
jgi:signal transduction histidine kinase